MNSVWVLSEFLVLGQIFISSELVLNKFSVRSLLVLREFCVSSQWTVGSQWTLHQFSLKCHEFISFQGICQPSVSCEIKTITHASVSQVHFDLIRSGFEQAVCVAERSAVYQAQMTSGWRGGNEWWLYDPEFCLIAESVTGGEQAAPLLAHSVCKLELSQFAFLVSLWSRILFDRRKCYWWWTSSSVAAALGV